MEVTNEVLLSAIQEQTKSYKEYQALIEERFIAVSKCIDSYGSRLADLEAKSKRRSEDISYAFEEQSKRIDNLYKKVNTLAEERPIKTVRNADGNKEAALQRDEAYETFEEAGFGRLEALKALRDGGKLSTTGDPGHKYTKLVRLGNEVVRTVVVFI